MGGHRSKWGKPVAYMLKDSTSFLFCQKEILKIAKNGLRYGFGEIAFL